MVRYKAQRRPNPPNGRSGSWDRSAQVNVQADHPKRQKPSMIARECACECGARKSDSDGGETKSPPAPAPTRNQGQRGTFICQTFVCFFFFSMDRHVFDSSDMAICPDGVLPSYAIDADPLARCRVNRIKIVSSSQPRAARPRSATRRRCSQSPCGSCARRPPRSVSRIPPLLSLRGGR